MKINSITLTNIRSYLNETIYFGEGVNFISGPNGTGKTTIVESIGFALFDAKPDLGRDVTQFSYFVRYGCTSGKISVEIEDNRGEEYTFERKINKRTTSWTVYEKESEMELNLHGSDDVKEFIREHIDLDKNQKLEDVFTDIIGVSQGSFTMPFLLARADRIKHFNTILNVLEYRKAADKGIETKKYYDGLITESEKQIAILTERLSNRDEVQEQNISLNKELLELEKELTVNEQEKKNFEDKVRDLNKLKNTYLDTEKAIKNLQAQILAKNEALKGQKDNLNNAYLATEIVIDNKCAYQEYKNAQGKADILGKQKEQKEQLLRRKVEAENKFNMLIADANNKIAVYKSRQETSNEQISKAEAEIIQIENKIKNVQNENATNETLKLIDDAEISIQNFYEYFNTIEKCSERIKSGLDKWKDNEKNIEIIQNELKTGVKLLEESKAYENALTEREELTIKKGILINNIDLQNTYLTEIEKGICPVCHSNCADIPNLKVEITGYLENIRSELDEINKQLELCTVKIQNSKPGYESALFLREKESELCKLHSDKTKYSDAFISYSDKIKNINMQDEYMAIKNALDQIKKILAIKAELRIYASFKPYNNDPEEFAECMQVYMSECRNIYKDMTDAVSEAKGHISSTIKNLKEQKNEYIEAVKKQKKFIDETNKLIERTINSIEKGYKFIDIKKKEYNENNEKIEDQLKSYKDLDDSVKANRSILEKNKKQYELYMNNYSIASKGNEIKAIIEKLEAEKTLIERECSEIESQLSVLALKFNEQMLEEANKSYSKAIEITARAKSIYEQKQNELNKNQKEMERLNKQQEDLESAIKELVKQKKGKALAKIIFDDVLKNAGEKIGGIYRQRLTSKANNLFKEMTNENVELIWEDDYNVMILDYYANEKRQRVFRQLSGGEQMAAALSIRLSFISALTNTRIAFFDEPTTNLDSERRNNLADLLPHVINDFKQVFVISHDDTFDSVTQNLIKLQKTREGTKNF